MKFKLTEIDVNNFLSYKNAKFSDLNDYNILIGKNNSGKSNLFKILNAIKENFITNKYNRLILFDGNEEEKASLTLTFKLSEEFRRTFFTELNNTNHFSNAFHESNRQIPNKWNSETLDWLIKKGYFEFISVLISWIPETRGFIIESINSINKNSKTTIYEVEIKELETQFTILEKNGITGAKTLRDFFEKFYITKTPRSFYPNRLNGFYTSPIDGRIATLDSKSYSLLPLRFIIMEIIKPFFESISYLPDKRYFEGFNEITDLDKTKPSLDGNNISKYLANIKINNPDWLNELNKEIRIFFPYIEDFSSKVEDNKTIFHSKEKNLKSLLRLENLGAGLIHFVNYLINFKFYGKDGIIFLLEEPELFIFPGLQKILRDYFIEKSKNMQIFITTHSPNFLSNKFERCSIYQIKKDDVVSKVKKISESEINEVFQELNLDLYDYLLYDGIIFVEGFNDLRVFNILINSIIEEKVKIISCEGKRNAQYYAEARILKILKGTNLKSLFLFDSDRGNRNIWQQFRNDREYYEELERISLRIPAYEMENIFLQPILIFDYLWSIGKIENLNENSKWLNETIKNIFEETGKNSRRFILKKFTDTYFNWIPEKNIEDMIDYSQQITDFNDLFQRWVDFLEYQIKHQSIFYKNLELDKKMIIDKFNYNKMLYESAIENERYNYFVSGKEVLNKLKTMIIDKYHLSKSISPEILAEHLIEFLSDFQHWINSMGVTTTYEEGHIIKTGRDSSLESLNEQYFKQIPFQNGFKKESENDNSNEFVNEIKNKFENRYIDDFQNYCEQIKNLVLQITNKLNCKFKEKYDFFKDLDFHYLLPFLITRWILKK